MNNTFRRSIVLCFAYTGEVMVSFKLAAENNPMVCDHYGDPGGKATLYTKSTIANPLLHKTMQSTSVSTLESNMELVQKIGNAFSSSKNSLGSLIATPIDFGLYFAQQNL